MRIKLISLIFFLIIVVIKGDLLIQSIFGDNICISSGKLQLSDNGNGNFQQLNEVNEGFSYPITKEDVEDVLQETQEISFRKYKHPSSFVQEIAALNEVNVKYYLEKEEGPSHSRVFTIKLKLGKESYLGIGRSHKEAKMNAALEAIISTKYKVPEEEQNKNIDALNLPPMVQLNSIASQKGYKINYEFITWKEYETGFLNLIYVAPTIPDSKKQKRLPKKPFNLTKILEFDGNETSSLKLNVMDKENNFYVRLTVEDRQYYGKGFNKAMAKNLATIKALKDLEVNEIEEFTQDEVKKRRESNKSPVSKINQLSSLYKENADFLIEEEGPAHEKIFTATLNFLSYSTKGKANKKKHAKQNAAEEMIKLIEQDQPELLESFKYHNNEKINKNKKKDKVLKKSKIEEITEDISDYISNVVNWPSKPIQQTEEDGSKQNIDSNKPKRNFKSRLLNLLTANGIDMNYFDLNTPKGDLKTRLLAVNTSPSYICYGFGKSQKEAEEFAAAAMYKTLQNFGFDSLIPDNNLKMEHIRDYKELLQSFQIPWNDELKTQKEDDTAK